MGLEIIYYEILTKHLQYIRGCVPQSSLRIVDIERDEMMITAAFRDIVNDRREKVLVLSLIYMRLVDVVEPGIGNKTRLAHHLFAPPGTPFINYWCDVGCEKH